MKLITHAMRKKPFIIVFLFVALGSGARQSAIEDSLHKIISQQKGDTTQVNAMIHLGFVIPRTEAAFALANGALALAQKINYRKGEADCFILKSYYSFTQDPGESIFCYRHRTKKRVYCLRMTLFKTTYWK